jgi:hypothetical protein
VASIQRRGREIRVLLESPVPSLVAERQEGGQPARALVRVSRSDLPERAQRNLADVDFAFFDGAGRLLAYGTGTSIVLAERDLGARMLEAPRAEQAVPKPEAEAVPAPGAEEGLGMAPPQPTVAPSPQPAPTALAGPSGRRVALAWLGLGLWIILVVGVSIGIGTLIWRSRRRT